MNETMQHPEGQPQPQVPVPTRESVSERQVDTVLNIITHLQPYLFWTHREIEEGKERDLDGGVKNSAEVTFIKACDRLEAMLTDNNRWHMGSADDLYKSIIANQQSMKTFNEAQTLAVNELRRPSRIFHPSFSSAGEDGFVAYHVSSDFPGGILMGKGATPADACLDFDKAFHRLASEQIKFNEESLAKIRAAQERVQHVEKARAVGKRVTKVQKRAPKSKQ